MKLFLFFEGPAFYVLVYEAGLAVSCERTRYAIHIPETSQDGDFVGTEKLP
ncbi:MAG: hypothetical protein ACYSR4_04260 [Planctomycetota bacterium]